MIDTILPYAEVLFGALCIASAIFLFKPMKAYAARHGEKDPGKVFCVEDVMIIGWFILLAFGVGVGLFGIVG